MRLTRLILATLAAASIVLTSASGAVARRDTGTGTFVTICIGHTVSVIEVDADGQPVDPLPICPDCTYGDVAVLTGLAAPKLTQLTLGRGAAQLFLPFSFVDAQPRVPPARGPPLLPV